MKDSTLTPRGSRAVLWVAVVHPLRLGLCLSVLAAGTVASQTVPRLATPDLKLVGMSIHSDTSVVRRTLGAPDSVADTDDPSQAGPIPGWWYRDLRVALLGGTSLHGWWITGRTRATVRGLRVGDPDSQIRRRYGLPTTTSGDSVLVYCEGRGRPNPQCMYVWVIRHQVDRIYVGQNID